MKDCKKIIQQLTFDVYKRLNSISACSTIYFSMLRQVERVKFWFVGFFSPDFKNRSQFASKRKHGAIRR